MSTAQTMVAEITNYLNKVITMFAKSKGTIGDMLYVDNANGLFSFVPGAAVYVAQIATTTNEVTAAKAAMVSDPVNAGKLLINQFAGTLDTLNTADNTWTSTIVGYTDLAKPERVFYSPWSKRVWITTTYGKFNRLLTTGLTEVG